MTSNEQTELSRSFQPLAVIGLVARGAVMGVAEVLPGISGGTVALILGVYDRMVGALSKLILVSKDLVQMKWTSLRQLPEPLTVLVPLLVGMLIGAFIAINTIVHIIDTHQVLVLGAIFGLVLGAIVFTFRASTLNRLFLFLPLGLVVSLAIVFLPKSDSSAGWILIYVGGFLAFGAWILPGISGSLLLLILGLWQTMIEAFHALDWLKMLLFLTGILTGWLVFSHPVKVLLERHRTTVMALFCGLLLGSLWKVWPWRDGAYPVLPHQFDGNAAIIEVIVLMATGFGLVMVLSHVYTKNSS
ncbi:MAG: DUF368 domain-containing protein [Gammaproteobacteria bacterium]|nr:DUF368 domain-containing protein [Gammaproteobacteria bacterium]MYF38937.1 DUF368 domain-containing protein [Gammaproteobacteria bacterium]